MGTIYFVFVLLALVIINGDTQQIKYTKCFETVTHYYSSAQVSGVSKLYLSFQNHNFKTVKFNLSCDDFQNSGGIIQLEDLILMLPANEDDFCLDSNKTSVTKCSFTSQCSCCNQPSDVCKVSRGQQYKSCNGKQNCTLEVTSEFLDDCFGRQYDCEYKKCHSRWAQVVYFCQPSRSTETMPMTTGNEGTTYLLSTVSEEHTTANGQLKPLVIGAVVGAAIVFVVIILVVVCLKRHRKTRNRRKSVQHELDLYSASLLQTKQEFSERDSSEYTQSAEKSEKLTEKELQICVSPEEASETVGKTDKDNCHTTQQNQVIEENRQPKDNDDIPFADDPGQATVINGEQIQKANTPEKHEVTKTRILKERQDKRKKFIMDKL